MTGSVIDGIGTGLWRVVEPPVVFGYRLSQFYPTAELDQYLGEAKLDPARQFYRDRLLEFRTFFDVSRAGFAHILVQNGVPNGPRYKRRLYDYYDRTSTADLERVYAETAKYWVLRFLMRFERERDLGGFVGGLKQCSERLERPLRVLDFGCGISDLGLAAVIDGHQVTIADLADAKLDFAKWRYERNGFDVTVHAIPDTETPPPLEPDSFDVVVASEVMKQVRSPTEYLKMFHDALGPEGSFYCTQGTPTTGWFGERSTGARIEASIREGNSPAYRDRFRESFEQHDGRYWWRKRP
jgi:SAM-dependent methyltransferase